MESRLSRALDIAIYSINYIVISCALSGAAMVFKTSWVYILFFASNVWVTYRYWEDLRKKAGRWVCAAVFVCSFLIFCLAAYFVYDWASGLA